MWAIQYIALTKYRRQAKSLKFKLAVH